MNGLNISSWDMQEQIHAARQDGKRVIAFLPVGCTEQHGPFLPLNTDSIIAEGITVSLQAQLQSRYLSFILPAIYYSPTQTNTGYCGTITVQENCFRDYCRQIGQSVMCTQVDALVIVSGHGSADPALKEVAFGLVNHQFEEQRETICPAVVLSMYQNGLDLEALFGQRPGKHADWREFLLLYKILGTAYFDKKRMNALAYFCKNNNFNQDISIIYGVPMKHRSVQGVLGEPLPIKEDDWHLLSERLWEITIEHFSAKLVSELETFWHSFGKTADDGK